MCDCNKELLKYLQERQTKLQEDVNFHWLTDSEKDITERLEGRFSQVSEIISIILRLQDGKNVNEL